MRKGHVFHQEVLKTLWQTVMFPSICQTFYLQGLWKLPMASIIMEGYNIIIPTPLVANCKSCVRPIISFILSCF